MKILIDMNLSPEWVVVFAQHGITAVHWSTVGNPRAEDSVLMDWARANDYVVFTHDLDAGADPSYESQRHSGPHARRDLAHLEKSVIDVLQKNESILEAKALIVLDEGRSRVRILPLGRSS